MPSNADSVARELARLTQTIQHNIAALPGKVTAEMLEVLVVATPVKTGLARSNWIVTLGSPASGRAPVRSEVETVNTGAATARTVDPNVPDRWITNNVDYIDSLNAGSSRQAPAGFVEKAIDKGVRVAVREAADLLRRDLS